MIMRRLSLITLFLGIVVASGQNSPASGPLQVLKSNPRYFTDGSGKAIYLAGSHNWNNFVDTGHRRLPQTDPPAIFDYKGYLDLLDAHHHNFFRLWRWESVKWTDNEPAGVGLQPASSVGSNRARVGDRRKT
jgi:hypothetical protein